jgi:hypothetical protein
VVVKQRKFVAKCGSRSGTALKACSSVDKISIIKIPMTMMIDSAVVSSRKRFENQMLHRYLLHDIYNNIQYIRVLKIADKELMLRNNCNRKRMESIFGIHIRVPSYVRSRKHFPCEIRFRINLFPNSRDSPSKYGKSSAVDTRSRLLYCQLSIVSEANRNRI